MSELPASFENLGRAAWKPLTENREAEVTASKFSGIPWLNQEEGWPLCENCGQPLQLFLQLNLNELPQKLQGKFGDGLLQLFYCTGNEAECEIECEAWLPFAKSVIARIIQPKGEPLEIELSPVENAFRPKTITGWQESLDYPNPDEAATLGVNLSEVERDEMYDSGYPLPGDKLGGYPFWVQGIEYPSCPVCGNLMRLLFQIDANDNLPYEFGDVGCGHITQCETHKEQLGFGWACS